MTNTQDLIKRLRNGQERDFETGYPIAVMDYIMDEAADAIEAAQAEIERLTLDLQTTTRTFEAYKVDADASPKVQEPLSDEQIEQAVKTYGVAWTGYRVDEHGFYTIPILSPYHYQLARAIERAHGIGGQQP